MVGAVWAAKIVDVKRAAAVARTARAMTYPLIANVSLDKTGGGSAASGC